MNAQMPARAYLAVKLTNLRAEGLHGDYWELYEAVADRLERLPQVVLHAPHRLTDPHSTVPDELTPRDIYLIDRLHVTHTDLVVACIELPSFGVGAELQIAADAAIPVLAFYYAQSVLEPSRLVVGMPSVGSWSTVNDSEIVRYRPSTAGRDELLQTLEQRATRMLAGALRHRRRERTTIAAKLNTERVAQQMSIETLAREAGVPRGTVELLAMAGENFERWLDQPRVQRVTTVSRDEVNEDRVLLPSLWVIERITSALGLPAYSWLPAMASHQGDP